MPFWLVLHPPGHPDKRRLMTVHDFYEYTERKGAPEAACRPMMRSTDIAMVLVRDGTQTNLVNSLVVRHL